MSIPLLHVFASVVLSLTVTAGATAAESSAHPCTTVTDPTERLACYDAAFPPAADAQSERDKALREFGLNKAQLRVRDAENKRDVWPDRIEATVARVSSRATGERVVTLDSGQVWLLTEVTSRGHLTSGDRVVIREAALGTYMLLTPKRVPLRARRIQ
ncbi:MAG TPA: hypothetical protein VHF02_03330 [Luteimonas sp.]|nr:hypothetical protein [Luteimonas sp.]